MARIRSIKPELPQSESMGNVSRDARLTFIQLFTLADDEGRLRGNSRMLASLLFPYDDGEDGRALTTGKDVEAWMVELEREGCITRYQIDGAAYVQIANWLIHQKIDKPSKSKIPAFVEPSRILAKPLETSSEEGIKDQGEEGIKDKDGASAAAAAAVVVVDPAEPEEPDNPRAAPMPPREDAPESQDPAIALSVALRKLGVDATFTHPAVQAWAAGKTAMDVLVAAVALAREQKGPTAKIAPNYLLPIVDKLLNPPAAAAASIAKPAAPIQVRKPTGMDPKGTDESYEEYDARIRAAEAARRKGPTP
jgi:hypothetical protein